MAKRTRDNDRADNTHNSQKRVCNAHSTRIPISNTEALISFMNRHDITYLPAKKPNKAFEKNAFLAPIALLGLGEKNHGIISEADIAKNVCIGEYCGDKSKPQKKNRDPSYRFEIEENDDGRIKWIDAKKSRNWTAYINGASCEENANVFAEICAGGKLLIKTKRAIKKGEQILLFYGDDYTFDTNFRFINSTDNDRDSIDILNAFAEYYPNPIRKCHLANGFVKFFNLDAKVTFCIPAFTENEESANLPYLAYEPSGETLAAQSEQENIRPLMYACWKGQIDQVQKLLNAKANPNIQSSIKGCTPLHLVAASPIAYEQKEALINLLLEYNAIINLQDSFNHSLLHHAVISGDIRLVEFILSKDNTTDLDNSLNNLVNNDEYDAFLLALSLGHKELVIFFSSSLTQDAISAYKAQKTFKKALSSLENAENCSTSIKLEILNHLANLALFNPLSSHIKPACKRLEPKEVQVELPIDLVNPAITPEQEIVCVEQEISPAPDSLPSHVISNSSLSFNLIQQQSSELFLACYTGNLGVMTTILSQKYSELMTRYNNDLEEVHRCLYEFINLRNEHGDTALILFIKGQSELFDVKYHGFMLLKNYMADPSLLDAYGNNLLHIAMFKNDLVWANILLHSTQTIDTNGRLSISNFLLISEDSYKRDSFFLTVSWGRVHFISSVFPQITPLDLYYYLDSNLFLDSIRLLINADDIPLEAKYAILGELRNLAALFTELPPSVKQRINNIICNAGAMLQQPFFDKILGGYSMFSNRFKRESALALQDVYYLTPEDLIDTKVFIDEKLLSTNTISPSTIFKWATRDYTKLMLTKLVNPSLHTKPVNLSFIQKIRERLQHVISLSTNPHQTMLLHGQLQQLDDMENSVKAQSTGRRLPEKYRPAGCR